MPRVVVDVMLKPEILDPQGQAVANALPRLGVDDVASVRIGRRIEIEFTGDPDLDRAREIADKLLVNPVIEDFVIHLIDEADEAESAAGAESAGGAAGVESAGASDAPAGADRVDVSASGNGEGEHR